jgi:predicted PurR-regulated permease PerM
VVLLGLAGVLLVVSVLLVLPFLQYFLLAVLLYYLLQPVHTPLADRTTPRIAAASLVVGATGVFVLPLLIILRSTLKEASRAIVQIRSGAITLETLEAQLFSATGLEVNLTSLLRAAARELGSFGVGNVVGLFGRVSHLTIGLIVTLFLLYYFLKDGPAFNSWLHETVPIPVSVQAELQKEFKQVILAMVAVHGLIAVIQGIIAGIGLVVVGISNVVFWTTVMIILALVPIIGSFLVWGPAALYLIATGDPLAGGFLLVYGTIVVGLTDDYLRPIIAHQYTQLNPGIIILGIVGGISLLGFPGIFFGPIIIGSLRATLDVYRREHFRDSQATST